MKKIFTILFLIFSFFCFAQNIVITGAGTSTVNGTYVNNGTQNGKPKYINNATQIEIIWSSTYWLIIDNVSAFYYSTNDVASPNLVTTWLVDDDGVLPVPQVATSQNIGDATQTFGKRPGFDNSVYATAEQADGKIIVGGQFTNFNGITENRIIRLNSDGSKDTSFNVGTGFGYSTSQINTIVVQTDGKIIIGGTFNSFNNVAENRIIRLNSDGTKDTSFNTGTGFNSTVNTIKLQSDGKILVGGAFQSYNENTTNATRLVRLNSDGTIDSTFVTGTGFNSQVDAIVIQSDGKIIVGGLFTTFNGSTENRIIRLNSNGTKDTTFTTGTGFNSQVTALTLQSDGKIILVGDFTGYNGNSAQRIVRLNAFGFIDSTFSGGSGFNVTPNTIAIQGDGNVIVGGGFTEYNGMTLQNRVIRLTGNGSKDTSFNIGTGFNANVYSITILSDANVLIGGNFATFNSNIENYLVELNFNGTKDTSFNLGSGFNNNVDKVLVQTDGKILAAGTFEAYGNERNPYIIRLNSNGTKDTSFNTGTGFNGNIVTMALQTDGKIIAGGFFNSVNGNSRFRIVRLNTDGTVDASFNIGTGFNNVPRAICIQPDGKILIGGAFTTYNGGTVNRIVRLNTDGSLDNTIDFGSGSNPAFQDGQVNTIAIQSDGKILVGGTFSLYKGQTVNRIVRINTDGTRDTLFNMGTGFDGTVNTIAIQNDGKIIVGGLFSVYDSTNNSGNTQIIRLNSDGTKDNTFVTGSGFNGGPSDIKFQIDGKILIGGPFTVYNSSLSNRLVRLNEDGSKDTSFDIGSGFNNQINTIALQNNDKIIVGGAFTTYKGDNNSAHLIGLSLGTVLSSESFETTTKLTVYPNPSNSIFNIDIDANANIELFDITGKKLISQKIVFGTTELDLSNYNTGIYLLKVTNENNQSKTVKLIKQ